MTTSNNSPEACAAYPDARPEEESVNFPWVDAHNARQEHFRNVFDAGRAMQREADAALVAVLTDAAPYGDARKCEGWNDAIRQAQVFFESDDTPLTSTTLEAAFFPGLTDQLDALTIRTKNA